MEIIVAHNYTFSYVTVHVIGHVDRLMLRCNRCSNF